MVPGYQEQFGSIPTLTSFNIQLQNSQEKATQALAGQCAPQISALKVTLPVGER